MSIAEKVKWYCTNIAKYGFNLTQGVLYQTNRRNAKPHYFQTGQLLAERRTKYGFQTDALYMYADKSMLLVHRTVGSAKLAATKGESK